MATKFIQGAQPSNQFAYIRARALVWRQPMTPRLPSRSFAALALAGAGLILSLTACKASLPKPTHEIGKVEYDKLVDWRELVKLGPKGCRKYLGQTLTFTDLANRGAYQTGHNKPNVCAQGFDLLFWPYLASDGKDATGKFFLDVYFNYGPEAIESIAANYPDTIMIDPNVGGQLRVPKMSFPDTFMTDISVEHPITVNELICDSCRGTTRIIESDGRKGAISEQGPKECILESRALHITGKVVGVKEKENQIMIIPTGMAW
jgi:hypothetical protein